jgi:hypothetical protein
VLGEYLKRWRAWAHGGVNTKDLGHPLYPPDLNNQITQITK